MKTRTHFLKLSRLVLLHRLGALGRAALLCALAAALATPAIGAGKPENKDTLRLGGKVLDVSGKPVAGATVECLQMEQGRFSSGEMESKQKIRTGSDGGFEFSLAPITTLLVATQPGLAPAWNQYWNPLEATNETLTLAPASFIGGSVVDDSDKPMPGAEVRVSRAYMERTIEDGNRSWGYIGGKPAQQLFWTRADAAGKFRITNFPTNAGADLEVKLPGKVLRELKRQYVSPENMRCRAGQDDVRLVMDVAGAVEGQVLSETGQPLPGVRVALQRERTDGGGYDQPPMTETKADGRFSVTELATGSYTVRAAFGTSEPAEWVADSVQVTVEAGQTAKDVKITGVRGGVLQAKVISEEEGKPLSGVHVGASAKGNYRSATTKEDGRAWLRLPAGDHKLVASRENISVDREATVEVGQTNQLEFKLREPPKLVGRVLDPSGTPAAGLEVTLLPNWFRSGPPVKTDEQGRFEMKAGERRQMGGMNETPSLVVRDPKRNLAVAEEIDPDSTKVELKLQPGMTISGKVQNVDGKPLPTAQVRLFLWSGNSGSQFESRPTKVDQDGKFEITALPPGRKYSADATAKGYGSANQQVNADEGNVALDPFVLNVADRQLAGQVVDADDKPVSGAWIHMYGQGQPNANVRSDNKGYFKFDAVCEGSIQISANAENAFGNARADAGDTNVVVKLGNTMGGMASRESPKRPSLKGKPLPDLKSVNLELDCAPAGKPVLLCLFDVEQRPSRRFAKVMADQHAGLKQKGVAVLGIQAAVTGPDTLKEWQDSSKPPFPIGHVAEKNDKTKWAADVQSLPWLILTDSEHRVLAEGFPLDELESKLKGVAK